jgi:hypothetical protein
MILYATAKSERATKGQGGNNFLFIDVTDVNEKPVITLNCWIYPTETEIVVKHWAMPGRPGYQDRYYIPTATKGNNQKGDVWDCKHKPLCDVKNKGFCKDNIPF